MLVFICSHHTLVTIIVALHIGSASPFLHATFNPFFCGHNDEAELCCLTANGHICIWRSDRPHGLSSVCLNHNDDNSATASSSSPFSASSVSSPSAQRRVRLGAVKCFPFLPTSQPSPSSSTSAAFLAAAAAASLLIDDDVSPFPSSSASSSSSSLSSGAAAPSFSTSSSPLSTCSSPVCGFPGVVSGQWLASIGFDSDPVRPDAACDGHSSSTPKQQKTLPQCCLWGRCEYSSHHPRCLWVTLPCGLLRVDLRVPMPPVSSMSSSPSAYVVSVAAATQSIHLPFLSFPLEGSCILHLVSVVLVVALLVFLCMSFILKSLSVISLCFFFSFSFSFSFSSLYRRWLFFFFFCSSSTTLWCLCRAQQ